MSGYGATYAQMEDRRHALLVDQVLRNAQKIRQVAASLPACVVPEGQCPLHDNSTKPQELVAPRASTTSSLSGGIGGCYTHGRA